MGTEPVILLTFIEHNLQGAYAQRQQGEPDIVELDSTLCRALEIRRIFHQFVNQEQSGDTHGQIDEENPTPRVTVGHPAAQSWPDSRCAYCRNAVKGKCQTALLRRKSVGEDCLHHRLQAASTRALQDAKEKKETEARRDSAQQGTHSDGGEAG